MRQLFLFTFLLSAFVSAVWAAPTVKVGPKDGMVVESLPPLETPQLAAVEKMANTTFPATLEKMGDYTSAVLEWQRIAHEYHGDDRTNALFRVAALQVKLKQEEAARITLKTLQTEAPDSPRAAEVLYYLSQVGTPEEQEKTRTAMAALYPTSPWSQTALMENVWHQARTSGKVQQNYNLENALKLEQRLSMLNQSAKARLLTATLAGVVPGGGLMFLGQYAQGGIMLLAWALFGLAFLSACRHRHYAYAFIFVFPFAALWVCSPGAGAQLAHQLALKERNTALASWKDLAPPPLPTQATAPTVVENAPPETPLPYISGTQPLAIPAADVTNTQP